MLAMAEHEGWYPRGSKQNPDGSNSYKNHNPGNLRKSPFSIGTVNGFAIFRDDVTGWHAFEYDLLQKIKGNTVTGLNGDSTIRSLIYTWAPPSDNNDSAKYLDNVLKITGFTEDMTLKELLE